MIVILIIIFVILLIFVIKRLLDNHFLKRFFATKNTYTFGSKGTGKDLTFQHVINMRKKSYLSNINYGGKFNKVAVKDLNVAPNTFENLINDKIFQIEKKDWEGKDIYLSDCGIYLPNYYDYLLNKNFPSMPIFFALSRHLYNMQIHINSQAFGRVWVKLREQCDGFVKCVWTIKIFGLLFTKRVCYDRLLSAENDVRPFSWSIFNKFNRALYEQFLSTNGLVKPLLNVQWVKNIKYDSRYFHKLFFGVVWVDKQTKFGKFITSLKSKFARKKPRKKIVNEKGGSVANK